MAEETGQALIWDANILAPDGSRGAWTNSRSFGYQPSGDWMVLGVKQPTTVPEALDIIRVFLSSTGMEIRLPRGLPQVRL